MCYQTIKTDVCSFIVKEVSKEVNFIHLTFPENIESILEKGLLPGEESSVLDRGVYIADSNDYDSVSALLGFIQDLTGGDMDEELTIVEGTYSNKYIKCVGCTDRNFAYMKGVCVINSEEGIPVTSAKTYSAYEVEHVLQALLENENLK